MSKAYEIVKSMHLECLRAQTLTALRDSLQLSLEKPGFTKPVLQQYSASIAAVASAKTVEEIALYWDNMASKMTEEQRAACYQVLGWFAEVCQRNQEADQKSSVAPGKSFTDLVNDVAREKGLPTVEKGPMPPGLIESFAEYKILKDCNLDTLRAYTIKTIRQLQRGPQSEAQRLMSDRLIERFKATDTANSMIIWWHGYCSVRRSTERKRIHAELQKLTNNNKMIYN